MKLTDIFTSFLFASSTVAVHIPRQSNGTGYSVKTPPLDTPWTYEVGTNPWPEYVLTVSIKSQC
jgi:hypothetical protein